MPSSSSLRLRFSLLHACVTRDKGPIIPSCKTITDRFTANDINEKSLTLIVFDME